MMHHRPAVGRATIAMVGVIVVLVALVAFTTANPQTVTHTSTTTAISQNDYTVTTTSTQTLTSTHTSTITSIQVSTSTVTTATTDTVVSMTNSSIPGYVEINGVIASQIYKPTLVKFLQDECTNAPYHIICDPCLTNATTTSTSTSTTSSGAVPVPCLENLYSANITIVETQQLGSNASQVTYYGNFSISVPNDFAYTIIPWVATSAYPAGEGLAAGYFLVDTSSTTINEPGVWCYFPQDLNYSFNNDVCSTVSSSAFWFA